MRVTRGVAANTPAANTIASTTTTNAPSRAGLKRITLLITSSSREWPQPCCLRLDQRGKRGFDSREGPVVRGCLGGMALLDPLRTQPYAASRNKVNLGRYHLVTPYRRYPLDHSVFGVVLAVALGR